ncbi:hypothetical protein [Beijerinckia sp. L45]|uniref:hypothetical protein n=1 Tax=Beijerinckia sp. L45 TaxID=1641855 RepID=UPI00131D0623|nr:hypothetical protein [Beijerinckia sp. L45]
MTACGFTPDQLDAMPMHDVLALLRYWWDAPPTHEILAAVYQISRAPSRCADDPSNIGELIAGFPDGVIRHR